MAKGARKPKKPAEVEATPHKIVGEVWAVRFNKRKQVCGDVVVPVSVFQPDFKRAAKIFAARVKEEAGEGFVPVKFAGQLIGAKYNEHRVVTDEGLMAQIPQIFQEDFSKIDRLLADAVAQHRAAEAEAS